MTAFVGNTNLLTLLHLQDEITDEYIDDADVEVTVTTEAGVAVGGVTWPLTMLYVAGTDGNYRVALAADMELTAGDCYIAVIDADAGPDLVGHWEFHFTPLTRG